MYKTAVLPVVSYGCKTQSFTWGGENNLQAQF
jgi:hypothetical protein